MRIEMKKSWPPFNFSAGPAMLPKEVMEKAQSEFLNWNGTGLSIMDLSHREDAFIGIVEKAEADLRQLLSIPNDYAVLFCAGGASFHFSQIPLNFLKNKAAYVDSGIWGNKAVKEAQKYGKVDACSVLKDVNGKWQIEDESNWIFESSDQYDYVHFTPNETIGGVEFLQNPEFGRGKWVADMSSNILSKPINITDYGMIYAGAQKNIGPAGLSIVIVKKEWLESGANPLTPSLLDYRVLAENQSMYNTPPTYSWYLAGLVFDWIINQGGISVMEDRASKRSNTLYQFIDNSDFYRNPIAFSCRSRMNIPFTLKDESVNDRFLKQAHEAGLVALKGHRSVGGMRASLYNAMPEAGVSALVEFMQWFEMKNG